MRWDHWFMGLARYWATASKDPSTKVGAVIVNPQRIVVGNGYNGFPRGTRDLDEYLHNRPVKYARTVHAEMNAVLNASSSVVGSTLYVTLAPCSNCTAYLIQAGIKRIVHPSVSPELLSRWAESFMHSRAMLAEADIELHELEER